MLIFTYVFIFVTDCKRKFSTILENLKSITTLPQYGRMIAMILFGLTYPLNSLSNLLVCLFPKFGIVTVKFSIVKFRTRGWFLSSLF